MDEASNLHNSDILKDYFQHTDKYAAYNLPPSVENIFKRYYRHFFEDPKPLFTKDWGSDSPNWMWQKRHNEAIFDATQESVGAVFYHRDRMLQIERDVLAFPDRDLLIQTMADSCIGGGNTRILNYEYHGYIFAYRHVLDHLIRALSTLIKHDAHIFKAAETLSQRFPEHLGLEALIACKNRHSHVLNSFISTGDSKSIRDMIAHRKYVKIGSLNVNALGIYLSSPNEMISSKLQIEIATLKEILEVSLEATMSSFPKEQNYITYSISY